MLQAYRPLSRVLIYALVWVLAAPTLSSAAAADEEPRDGQVTEQSWHPPGPVLASGLRLAAAAGAQRSQQLPRGFRCGVGIPLATVAGAFVGVTLAIAAALVDVGTSPEGRTRVLVAAGAGAGLAFGIYGCTR